MQYAHRLVGCACQFRRSFCRADTAARRLVSCQRPAASTAAAAHAEAEVQRRLRHILVPASECQKLDQIQHQIEDGADFASMAEEHSVCPSRKQGGSMGWVDPAIMSPVLAEAAFQADIGELVQAESRHGLHLIHVEAERQAPKMRQMSVQELSALLNDPAAREDTQFIDVREPEEHRLAALPLFELQPLSRLDELRGHADQLDKGKHTVLLCHHGVRSAQAAAILQKYHDYTKVSNVVGGIDRFSVEVDCGVPRY
eukprot:jgi/Astpho2/9015/e_gw1.00133.141.1_t